MALLADVNMAVAGALGDMARVQETRERQWAYKRAASAVRNLSEPIDSLLDEHRHLPRIAHVGPASTRIVLEVLDSGRSETVDRAVLESGSQAEIDRRRTYRRNFLSQALVDYVLAVSEYPSCLADFQMHSTWSDGTQSLDDIVEGCLARGYTHAAVTDHSAGLPTARGMPDEKVDRQAAAIREVNARAGSRFRLLHGLEANILPDGEIDVSPGQRAALDIVVAAPHTGLRSVDSQTARMVAAVGTAGVHILGHPRGRKYDSRPGITADWKAVFAAAAESEVAIEIDGDPSRQDCDFELVMDAVNAGCVIALDSDAHAVDQLPYADIARAHAALAGVPAERVINSWPLDKLLAWSERRRAGLPRRSKSSARS